MHFPCSHNLLQRYDGSNGKLHFFYLDVEYCFSDTYVQLFRPAYAFTTTSLQGTVITYNGPMLTCINSTSVTVCNEGLDQTSATSLCRSVFGQFSYGFILYGSDLNNYVLPLTSSGIGNIDCQGNQFDSSHCSFSHFDSRGCSENGNIAVIGCCEYNTKI